jgi:hypothetical protein
MFEQCHARTTPALSRGITSASWTKLPNWQAHFSSSIFARSAGSRTESFERSSTICCRSGIGHLIGSIPPNSNGSAEWGTRSDYTHSIFPRRTKKWLPHLVSGIHNDGLSVGASSGPESVQNGRLLDIKLTSMRSPQRHGHESTAHFGFEVPTMYSVPPRWSGRSLMLATWLTPLMRCLRHSARQRLRTHSMKVILRAMRCQVGV